MVSPSTKRRAVNHVVEAGLGRKAQACRVLGLARSSAYVGSQKSERSKALHREIVERSEQKPRYGYRRITALMRREGIDVNGKRVQRVRRQEGLQVRRKQRKMRRVGESTSLRRRAEYPGHVWSWDFVEDQTENGSRFRMMTILDEYTRQWVNFRVGHSLRAQDVIETLSATIDEYGSPACIRSDNGPEFIAYAVQDWLKEASIKAMYIQPGSPWEWSLRHRLSVGQPEGRAKRSQNAYIESLHDKIGSVRFFVFEACLFLG